MTPLRTRIHRLVRPLVARRGVLRVFAVVLLLEVVGFAAWRFYAEWRLGRVVLTNDGPPLTVQVLDESGDTAIGEPVELVAESTLALPDGDYRLRVSGLGRLGQTYRVAVHSGETVGQRLSLDEGRPISGKPAATAEPGKAVGLDPKARGPRRPPVDPGFKPVRPVQSADLDGDGVPEYLALKPGPYGLPESLVAISAATSRTLWTAMVYPKFNPMSDSEFRPEGPGQPSSEWPWLVDLNSDGRSEIVVPEWMPPERFQWRSVSSSDGRPDIVIPYTGAELRDGYWGLRMLDGATGQTRWVRAMGPEVMEDNGVARLTDAPDLNGDGIRDLVAVSLFKGRHPPPSDPQRPFAQGRVYVDALSGKDGRRLWFWSRDLPPTLFVLTWPPCWWGRGPDGWPLLAVPLGGKPPAESQKNLVQGPFLWPVVHVLEGSTGRELHTIPGLYRPGASELNDDGLDDLWGEVDGQLRAFRGEPPEAWRSLGRFKPAGEAPRLDPISIVGADANGHFAPSHQFTRFRGANDLDGDGIGDVLLDEMDPDGLPRRGATVRRTGIARSGRDGHLLWQAVLEPARHWDEADRARGVSHELSTFPLPAGDLDGDGTPDVIVKRNEKSFTWSWQDANTGRPATLPLRALSGRTGRQLWSAGPLPSDAAPYGAELHRFDSLVFRPTERDDAPDVLVEYGIQFIWQGMRLPTWIVDNRMARLSGRDGRVVWDVACAEPRRLSSAAVPIPRLWIPLRHSGDLNGDGFLDVIRVNSPAPNGWPGVDSDMGIELRAISLKDGEKLWTREFPVTRTGPHQLLLAVGDIDGDRRAEVLVANAGKGDGHDQAISELNALDGQDGRVLWTWEGRTRLGMDFLGLCLARVEGGRRQVPCVAMGDPQRLRRLVTLDARGGVSADREPPSQHARGLEAADLDGDGNDELLLSATEGLSILSPDLKGTGARRPIKGPDGLWYLAMGQPGSVVPAPALGLDAPRGQPYQAGVAWYERDEGPWLLDPGDAARRPFWMIGAPNETVRRSAPPILSSGRYAPAQGTVVRSGPPRDDPRWERRLPWIDPIGRALDVRLLVAVIGLAMVNVIVPIAIVRLAARRWPWSLRVLMALPVAAAIPLAVFQTRASLLPAQIGTIPASDRLMFILGTLAGLPIVLYAGLAGSILLRRGWPHALALLGLTIVASALIAAVWLGIDSRAMPAIEHYGRSEWYLAAVPGAYAAGVLIPVVWTLRVAYRLLRRPRRAEVEAA
jgi:hypothetical protein